MACRAALRGSEQLVTAGIHVAQAHQVGESSDQSCAAIDSAKQPVRWQLAAPALQDPYTSCWPAHFAVQLLPL